jgi:hypothetical protein
MIPLLLTLLSASAHVEAVPLTSESQVRELCAALRDPGGAPELDPAEAAVRQKREVQLRAEALGRAYRVEVSAKGFVFGRYRPEQQEIELDGDRPLRAVDGSLTLDLEGIDEVAFHATPRQVKEWAARKASGELTLVVVFRASGPRCAGNAAAGIFRLQGRPLSWELAADEGTLAKADEEGVPVEVGPARVHTLRIERVALDLEEPGPDDARDRLTAAQPALDRCARGAHRTGAMVVAFAVQGGRLRDVQVVMDALRDEAVASCVAQALSGAQLRGMSAGSGRGTASIALQ